jgi:hypothetical protein
MNPFRSVSKNDTKSPNRRTVPASSSSFAIKNLITSLATMETAYLQEQVGTALASCLAQVAVLRPEDPIECLAMLLKQFLRDQNQKNEVCFELQESESDN